MKKYLRYVPLAAIVIAISTLMGMSAGLLTLLEVYGTIAGIALLVWAVELAIGGF